MSWILRNKMTKLKCFPYPFSIISLLLFQICYQNSLADNCNEYVCGSVVSKCLLTQSCQCKLSDCYCCKDCLNCLGDLFTECCACLDMCPKRNDTFSALAPKSQIGDFEGVSELFESLTAEDDEEQWTTIRFPMRANLRNRHQNSMSMSGTSSSGSSSIGDAIDRQASLQKSTVLNVNCTVIYLNACTTNKKCSQYCESMGSNSYRWFHDGCCECVGANCFNYGINESRCTACPDPDDTDADDNDDGDGDGDGGDADGDYGNNDDNDMDAWDYGEDEINYN